MTQLHASTGSTIAPTATESPQPVVSYESRLSSSISYVLDEGGRLFVGESEVNKTMRRITAKLNELGIPYAVAGGMALIAHGFRRFTEDIDILVSKESLDRIHENLDGLGWVRPFSTSKNLRDATNGVRVKFLVAGGFPGDGKPKPVSFPAPETVAEIHEGIAYVNLASFVALKLASGMTNPQRGKDLTDVEELIRALPLDRAFAESLAPYVRPKYLELWQRQQISPSRFLAAWRYASTQPLRSMGDLMNLDKSPVVQAMSRDEIDLADDLSQPGLAVLFTHNRAIADKYGMKEEMEVDVEKLIENPING